MAESGGEFWRSGAITEHRSPSGLRNLVRILFRRKQVVGWFALGVMVIALLGLLIATPHYEVTASLLVKKGAAQVPLTPKDSPVWIADHLDETDINTEIGILSSRVLIEEALRSMGEDTKVASPNWSWRSTLASLFGLSGSKPQLDPFDLMVDDVWRRLSIKAEAKANIIGLKLATSDQIWGQRFLDTLMDLYQRRRADLYAPPGAEQFFQRQTVKANQGVQNARQALSTYLAEAGITMIDVPLGEDVLAAEKSNSLTNHSRLETLDKDNKTEVRAQESELETLKAQILDESRRVVAALRDRHHAKLHNELITVEREEKELAEQQIGQAETLAKVRSRLREIRTLEDQLRPLLLNAPQGGASKPLSSLQDAPANGARAVNAKTVKQEVERLYRELADLGQLKRYDLNRGQDTSVPEGLERSMLDTEVAIRRIQERRRWIQEQLAPSTPNEGDKTPVATASLASVSGPLASRVDEPNTTESVWDVINATQEELARMGGLLEVAEHRQLAPVFLDLVARLVTAESELNKLVARGKSLEEQLTASSEHLARLNDQSARVRELRRELAYEEDAFERYRVKSDIAGIGSAMVKEQLVNTSVAQPAISDPYPMGPGKLLTLILGLVIGGLGGVALALVLEYFDLSLSTSDQVEHRLGLIHLASVPEGMVDGPLEIAHAPLSANREIQGIEVLTADHGGREPHTLGYALVNN
jgi:uncharacterized protein involved in exopolysaccharide biosynthesis